MKFEIDIFSDPVCPWCLVGLRRLNLALAELPGGTDVKITHHPFLLDPAAPKEGEDVADMLTRKYGRDPGQMWDRLEAAAAESGVELDMRKQKMRYPSQRAQVLIAEAAASERQHELAVAIGDAHYLEARNIADPDVLTNIAGRFGFDAGAVRAAIDDVARVQDIEKRAASAAAQGINGVPFFVFDNKYALSGAQPVEVFRQAIGAVMAESA